MNLIEFVQEGVFDKVKAEPRVKMRLKDLTASNVKVLSDEALFAYQEYMTPRYARIRRTLSEIRRKKKEIQNRYSSDFSEMKPATNAKSYKQSEGMWVRIGSEGEHLMDQLEGELEVYQQQYTVYSGLTRMFQKENKRREQLKKKESRTQAADDWPTYEQQHAKNTPANIPQKVSRAAGLKPSLANPYHGRSGCQMDKQYAGHPAHYPYWSNDWKRRILAMEELLDRNGKQGFEMMYACTFVNSGNRFNFMIIGAGGNFLWRKYDPCPAAGQNDVYLNGKKMKTSSLERMMSKTPNPGMLKQTGDVDQLIQTL